MAKKPTKKITRRPQAKSLRNRVREYVAGQGAVVTVSAVATALGASPKDVGSALASLVRTNTVSRVGRGEYIINNSGVPAMDGDVIDAQYFSGDSPITTTAFEGDHVEVETYADDSDNFIDWLSQHLGVSPDRVAVAFAFYEMFVAESADNRVGR